jgi:sensor histidine kinase YesM
MGPLFANVHVMLFLKYFYWIGGLISSYVKAVMLVDNFKVSRIIRQKINGFFFVIRYFSPAGDYT